MSGDSIATSENVTFIVSLNDCLFTKIGSMLKYSVVFRNVYFACIVNYQNYTSFYLKNR